MAKCIPQHSTVGTAPDTYLYSLARNGGAFATIGSDDSLRIFDGSLKLVKSAASAQEGITSLSAFDRGFLTAGRDGLVRLWDTRAQRTSTEIQEPKGNGVSSITSREHYIAAGTESTKEGLGDVSVLLYDARNPSIALRSYTESHTDTITQLAFHPTQPNLLCSGSADGLVSLFDVDQADEDDALQQVLNPRAAVHCTGFLSPSEVYVVTTDEHFYVYSVGETSSGGEKDFIDAGDVREGLGCTYVVNVVAGSQPIMACGHNVNQTLSLVQLDESRGWSAGSVIDLPGAHGEEVVRDVMVLEEEKKALSCGEDGQVKLWDLKAAVAR